MVLVAHGRAAVGDEDDAEAGGAGAADGVLDADVGHGAGHDDRVDVARGQQRGSSDEPGRPGAAGGLLDREVVGSTSRPDASRADSGPVPPDPA